MTKNHVPRPFVEEGKPGLLQIKTTCDNLLTLFFTNPTKQRDEENNFFCEDKYMYELTQHMGNDVSGTTITRTNHEFTKLMVEVMSLILVTNQWNLPSRAPQPNVQVYPDQVYTHPSQGVMYIGSVLTHNQKVLVKYTKTRSSSHSPGYDAAVFSQVVAPGLINGGNSTVASILTKRTRQISRLTKSSVAYTWKDKQDTPDSVWASQVYLSQNIILDSTYFSHRCKHIPQLTTMSTDWSEAFFITTSYREGLSCLGWVNRGQPVLSAGETFDAGPAAAYRESGGGISGKASKRKSGHRKKADRKRGRGGGHCDGSAAGGVNC